MAIDINVDVNKLDKFHDRVDEFQNTLMRACADLEAATTEFKSGNSEDDVRDICNMVDSVKSTVQAEKPAFESLKQIVENYSTFVKRIKAITGSN